MLLIAASVSAAPSAFPNPGLESVGTGPQTFPAVDARPADAQLLQLLDAKAKAVDFITLDSPVQLALTLDDSLTTLSSELTSDPLHELFAEPLAIANNSMRIAEVTPPSQPPILVPSLDNLFLGAPQLDVLLVLAIAAILYRFGAKALRLR
jgi:hypothetical protein